MSTIRVIFGDRGSGKTALNAYLALSSMKDRQRYLQSCDTIEYLNSLGYDFKLPPLEHVTYCNFDFYDEFDTFRYKLNPFRMNMPNNEGIEYDLFYPGASFHVMEGQIYWDSKRKLNRFATAFFENSRHNSLDITIDVQRPIRITADIRDLVTQFITILNLDFEYNQMGKIIKTKWKCLEFDCWTSCENYVKTKDVSCGKETEYVFNGCIFDFYNSYNNMLAYYDIDKPLSVSYDGEIENYIVPPNNHYDK